MARPVLTAVALLLLATITLTACGGEDADLLPGRTAGEITANLDAVRQLSDEGDCIGAESAAQQVGEQVEAIEGIDPRLKRALSDGAMRLREVVAECEEEDEGEETAPTEEEEEPEEEGEEEEPRERSGGGGNEEGNQGGGKGKGGSNPSPPGKGGEEGGGKAETPTTPETPGSEGGGGEPPSGGLEPSAPVEGQEE